MRNILFFFSVWVEERERELGLRRAQRKRWLVKLSTKNKNKNKIQNGLRKKKKKTHKQKRDTAASFVSFRPKQDFYFSTISFYYYWLFIVVILSEGLSSMLIRPFCPMRLSSSFINVFLSSFFFLLLWHVTKTLPPIVFFSSIFPVFLSVIFSVYVSKGTRL